MMKSPPQVQTFQETHPLVFLLLLRIGPLVVMARPYLPALEPDWAAFLITLLACAITVLATVDLQQK